MGCCKSKTVRVSETRIRIELKDLTADEIMAKFDVNHDGVLDKSEINNLMNEIVVVEKVRTRPG